MYISMTVFWTLVALLMIFLSVAACKYLPLAKAAHDRKLKERESAKERAHEELQRQKELAARQLDNLRQHKFIIHIRRNDGRKTCFETNLIKAFLSKGITVNLSTEATGKALANGDASPLNNGVLGLIGIFSNPKDGYAISCDFRVLSFTENEGGKIVGAHIASSYSGGGESMLADSVINRTGKMLLPSAE